MQKLYLVDGMSLVFRAYYAMRNSRLSNSNGEPTGAIFGFINILTSFLEKQEVENIAVVFDCSVPTFRHELYPEYKANRAKFPEDLAVQLPHIKKILEILGVARLEMPGYEADDIIGTIAKKVILDGYLVYCVTSDKDFYQLVDKNLFLVKNKRDSSDYETIDTEEVKNKIGILPSQVIDFLALMGDASDNIPGVKGIGEKTAMLLLNEFKTLEDIYKIIEEENFISNYKNTGSITASIYNKLVNGKELAFLSKELATINTNIPIDFNIEDFQITTPNFEELDKRFAELGFKQLREKWRKKKINATSSSASNSNSIPSQEIIQNKSENIIEYTTITSKNINNLLARVADTPLLSLRIDTDSKDRNSSSIIGISLAFEEKKAYYIPLVSLNKNSPTDSKTNNMLFGCEAPINNNNNNNSTNEDLVLEYVLCDFKSIFENPAIQKCGYDIKNDAYILKRYDINLSPVSFDAMLASYILDPSASRDISSLAERYLNCYMMHSEIVGSSSIAGTIEKNKKMFSAEVAEIAFRLYNILNTELANKELTYIANNIEMPLVEILADIEYTGISIDKNILLDIGYYLNDEIESLREKVYASTNLEFNIDSPKQLGEVLFEKMQLPASKKTKTGYSTDFQTLTELSSKYPVVVDILTYRQLVKLKNTYIDALPKLVHSNTQRIHTSFNQAITSTGRLSSTEPNLQNIPIKNEVGREIRRAIIPKNPEDFILSIDYSQIELRVMAYLSGDTNLISAFINGEDVHKTTAAVLFDVQQDRVTSEMRKIAKTVNFGIMYGLGTYGLSQRLNISRKESKEIIDNYFNRFPGIRDYILKTIEETRSAGFSKTLMGRRRYFPDINSQNHNIRAAAERAAVNMPVQGLASDIIKIAMVEIYQSIKQYNLRSKIILQVHDELVFEVSADEVDIIADIAYSKMSYTFPLGDVPLIVSMNFGKNWLESHS